MPALIAERQAVERRSPDLAQFAPLRCAWFVLSRRLGATTRRTLAENPSRMTGMQLRKQRCENWSDLLRFVFLEFRQ